MNHVGVYTPNSGIIEQHSVTPLKGFYSALVENRCPVGSETALVIENRNLERCHKQIASLL